MFEKYVIELNSLEYKNEPLNSKIDLNNPNYTNNPNMPTTSTNKYNIDFLGMISFSIY